MPFAATASTANIESSKTSSIYRTNNKNTRCVDDNDNDCGSSSDQIIGYNNFSPYSATSVPKTELPDAGGRVWCGMAKKVRLNGLLLSGRLIILNDISSFKTIYTLVYEREARKKGRDEATRGGRKEHGVKVNP